MNLRNQATFIAWRFYLMLGVIGLVVCGLLWRVFDLAILDQHFLRKQGDNRVLRMVSTPAFRGMIVDRNGFPLAVSTAVFSAWMNPLEFDPKQNQIVALAKETGMKPKELKAFIKKYQDSEREFIYVKRSLAPDAAARIKALNIEGLYLQQEYRRYYPEGEVTAHVVGFNNVDDRGQEGLELAYDQWLQGEPGKKWVIKDRLGRVISDVQNVQDQKAGNDLVLSVDRRIQYLAYRELMAGVTENQAQSGSVVVLDVQTGEVLAMVNVPSYNPNNRPGRMSDVFRNRAVTDSFEPGSTVKPFTVATALASRKFKPDTVIDTYPGWMKVGRNIVKDHDFSKSGPMTVTQVLQKSSNVGIAKIILQLPPDNLWNLLHRVGFGEVSGVNFPGEQAGSLVKHAPWGQFVLATFAIGYAMSVNTLQLARAYAVLAHDGKKLPVSFLKVDKTPAGEQVMDPAIARQVLGLMETVVEKGGTAETANVPGYRVGGKTGTALKVANGGYQKHHYTSSFVGIAPLSRPRLVVAVVIHDPQGKHYYGGMVSGPVFEKIMEGTLRLLDIPPDKPIA